MPMDLGAITRSLNKANGAKRPVQPRMDDPAGVTPMMEEERTISQEVADKVWEEEKEKIAAPKGDFAELCERIKALEDAVVDMAQKMELVNKHINATQKMLKKASKNGK